MTSTDRGTEALSALMDGEAQELELRRALDAIDRDPALRSRWQRQHRVSAGRLAWCARGARGKVTCQSKPFMEHGGRCVGDSGGGYGRSAADVAG